MPNDSIYVTQGDKLRLAQMAADTNRKLVEMLRYLMNLYDATAAVERAHILARHQQQQGG